MFDIIGNHGHFRRLFIAALSVFMLVSGPSYGASPTNSVMIIDASRSMWGQIDGVNKVVILQNVLDKSFRKFDGQTNLGIVAYGHRQDSGCTDIELIRPLGLLKAADYNAIVRKIRPKGSTPISNALKLAAQSATSRLGTPNVILISDGLDNCRGNPCGVAASIKKNQPNLKIHVIAFDKKQKEELLSLSCISSATGGLFASATNEAELMTAVNSAMSFVASAPVPVAQAPITDNIVTSSPQASAWQPVTSSSAEEISRSNMEKIAQVVERSAPGAGAPAAGQSGPKTQVSFVALLREGGQQITSGVIWRVFGTKADQSGQHQLVSTHRDATPTAVLAPGEYLVNAAYGRAHVTKKITVAVGKDQTELFVINAGGLRLSAVLASGGPISTNNVTYTIYGDEQDQFGEREKILANAKPGLVIRLNSGIYHIVSQYGNANAVVEADVTIEPGKLTEATINHQAGRVTFKLVLQPGGEALANTQWEIVSQTGDVVKKSAGALPTHILAAGDYAVIANHSGKKYKLPFAVQSGDNKQVELVIQ